VINMAKYDFEKGRKRIQEIFGRSEDNMVRENAPVEKEFTFDNGYHCWVASISVSIHDSAGLFSKYSEKKAVISKIIRSFTSEIIEILNSGSNIRDVGVRGDCVYGMYVTPGKDDTYDVIDKAITVNTFVDMLNSVLKKDQLDPVSVGIGVASSQDIVLRAARPRSEMNTKTWIGEAVTTASELSSLASEGQFSGYNILISDKCFFNITDRFKAINGDDSLIWFKEGEVNGSKVHYCNVKKSVDKKNW